MPRTTSGEIIRELDRRGARAPRVPGGGNFNYDVEEMKLLLEELVGGEGVGIRLHTRVVSAHRDQANRLTHVLTESKSGREAWKARLFIDTTGDGDLAALAGCGFDLGRPGSGEVQPMSLIALLTGMQAEAIWPFVGGGLKEPKERLFHEMQRAGVTPSYGRPIIMRIYEDLFSLIANHEYGVSALDAQAITEATIRARQEIHTIVGALKSLGPPWQNMRIVATGGQIGVREGRRIHGRYKVCEDDLRRGVEHEDAVCKVNFGIDVHHTNPRKGTATEDVNRTKTRPYTIPLRALIAKDVDGLLMAGRCISGDFLAHSSYRVTGNAVAMGQGAGVAAALAVKEGCLPQELPWEFVRAGLEKINSGSDAREGVSNDAMAPTPTPIG